MKFNAYERIAQLVPVKVRVAFTRELAYSTVEVPVMKFIGFVMAFGVALSFAVAFNLWVFFDLPFLPSWVGGFVLFVTGAYLWLSLSADSAGAFVEKILPDALQLMYANLKSGVNTEQSLFISARPEFGPLERVLKQASKQIFSGERVEVALMDMTLKIKSGVFERTMWLITNGIKSGGALEDLLVQIAEDLREEQAITDKIRANVSLYTLLIFFASAVGAPLLFGVSSFIVAVLSKYAALSARSGAAVSATGRAVGGGIVGVPQSTITPDFVFFFAALALVVNSIFGGLTIGVINKGRERHGVRFIPALLVVSLVLFLLVRWFLFSFFSVLV